MSIPVISSCSSSMTAACDSSAVPVPMPTSSRREPRGSRSSTAPYQSAVIAATAASYTADRSQRRTFIRTTSSVGGGSDRWPRLGKQPRLPRCRKSAGHGRRNLLHATQLCDQSIARPNVGFAQSAGEIRTHAQQKRKRLVAARGLRQQSCEIDRGSQLPGQRALRRGDGDRVSQIRFDFFGADAGRFAKKRTNAERFGLALPFAGVLDESDGAADFHEPFLVATSVATGLGSQAVPERHDQRARGGREAFEAGFEAFPSAGVIAERDRRGPF